MLQGIQYALLASRGARHICGVLMHMQEVPELGLWREMSSFAPDVPLEMKFLSMLVLSQKIPWRSLRIHSLSLTFGLLSNCQDSAFDGQLQFFNECLGSKNQPSQLGQTYCLKPMIVVRVVAKTPELLEIRKPLILETL